VPDRFSDPQPFLMPDFCHRSRHLHAPRLSPPSGDTAVTGRRRCLRRRPPPGPLAFTTVFVGRFCNHGVSSTFSPKLAAAFPADGFRASPTEAWLPDSTAAKRRDRSSWRELRRRFPARKWSWLTPANFLPRPSTLSAPSSHLHSCIRLIPTSPQCPFRLQRSLSVKAPLSHHHPSRRDPLAMPSLRAAVAATSGRRHQLPSQFSVAFYCCTRVQQATLVGAAVVVSSLEKECRSGERGGR